MKSRVMFRLLFLILLLIAIGYGVFFWKNRVVKLEAFLSKKLNTKVQIEKLEFSLHHIELQGFKIYNPPSSTLPFAFQGNIRIEVNPLSLWKRVLQIRKVIIDDPVMSIEFYNLSGSDNNWSHIFRNFPKSTDSRYFVIKNLTINNLKFEGILANKNSFSLPPIPYLQFENIGNEKPLTIVQVARILFQSILTSLAHQSNLEAILDNVVILPQDLLKGVTSNLPINQTRDLLEEGVETIKRKTKEAVDFLQELFSN